MRLRLYRAINPDFTVIHVQRVDTEGNAHIDGPVYDNVEKAKSAKTLVVTCEEVVTPEYVRRSPERTILPGFLVKAIVEAPFGAHPYACYKYYDYDWDHIEYYAKQAKEPSGFADYLENYVLGTDNEWEYLEKILRLRANSSLGYSTYYGEIV